MTLPPQGASAYVEVAVDVPLSPGRTFSYAVPAHLPVATGQMVQVPFGPRMADGIVFEVAATPAFTPVRPIHKTDPLGPLLSPVQLTLARWISGYYRAPLFAATAPMLPPGFRSRTRCLLSLGDAPLPDSLHKELSALFDGKRRIGEEVLARRWGAGAQRAIDRLVRQGALVRSWAWRQPGGRGEGEEQGEEATIALPAEGPLTPTPFQGAALAEIVHALGQGRASAFLLHGATGSGKTEVYLQALEQVLVQGKGGIVLVPEISLTPQMMHRFQARFPGRVAMLHSRQPQREHRAMWWDIRRGRFPLVVGSRSALFAPVKHLGLVVLDEEHEWSYKQEEAEPRYHARTVALRLAELTGSVVILGSATPDVVTYHRSIRGEEVRLLELPHRVGRQEDPGALPGVQVVDMRQELRGGNRSIFSRLLRQALLDTVEGNHQALLFINRRGAASLVQCRECGAVVSCPSCDIPLTYHTEPERLVCHQCNRRRPVPALCPACRSSRIRFLGLGTQRVVAEVEQLLPGVRTLRWDRDAVPSVRSHEEMVCLFGQGKAQVLIGTQMTAQGLHFPGVTLVGVVLADIGLHVPDFRAGERLFQLLCQVVGRAGRGPEEGRAIVQTYRPDHYAIVTAAAQDYRAFYQEEVSFRRSHALPPFSHLLRLAFSHTNAGRCQREAERLGRALRHQQQTRGLSEVAVLGPAPAYAHRLRGRYRWQLLLRGPDPNVLLRHVELSPSWQIDVDPISLT